MNNKQIGRFFIVGCPRSGTTLLQSLIAAHPLIATFPESHFFSFLKPKKRWLKMMGIASFKVKKRLYQFLDEMDQKEMEKLIPKQGFLVSQYTNAFIRILDNLAIKQNKMFWIEKTPSHLHYIKLIEKYLPIAKFIHVLRNGEDVVASLYEVTHKYPEEWDGPRDIDQCIKRWNQDINISLKHIKEDAHLLITYEGLIENPEVCLRKICRFLEIEFDLAMLKYQTSSAKKVILDNEPWKETATQAIRNINLRKFDKLFNKNQRDYISKRLRRFDTDLPCTIKNGS